LVDGPGARHQFACHYPVGTPENKEAFDRNLAAGLPQTLVAAGKMAAREDIVTDYAAGPGRSDLGGAVGTEVARGLGDT
jgi:hypothetical protein